MTDGQIFTARVIATGPVAEGRLPSMENVELAVGAATQFLVAEIKRATPVGATGALRGSVADSISTVDGAVRSTISTVVEYGMVVEQGGRPHMPPVEALIPWVKAHSASFSSLTKIYKFKQTSRGQRPVRRQRRVSAQQEDAALRQIAWAIARAIKKRGTSVGKPGANDTRPGPTGGRGYFMFEDTFTRNLDEIERRFFAPLGLKLVREMESR